LRRILRIGFKWLGNKALELRSEGIDVLFSYEEALGYCCGKVLCDKDGISAASIFTEMANAVAVGWQIEGDSQQISGQRRISDLYQDLCQKYGAFVSYNSYVICHDPIKTNAIFTKLRTNGPNNSYWTSVADVAIIAIKDITVGYDSTAPAPDFICSMPQTPDSHMIMYDFANGVTITLRTSGTEPKIKYYTEIAGQPGQSVEELRMIVVQFVDAAINQMLEPEVNGLLRA
jgi:phosphomannomutase